MPKDAIISPAASRQKWPVSLVICATAPSSPMPTPTLVEALQFASEIRRRSWLTGYARWTATRLRSLAYAIDWNDVMTWRRA